MLNRFRIQSVRGAASRGILAAILLAASSTGIAADVAVSLCAKLGNTGPTGFPPMTPVYGYSQGACATPTLPGGPVITVNAGDVVTVTLTNNLAEPSGLLFQGQSLAPDTQGAPPFGTRIYKFTAANPGTYLYEAAPLLGAEYQVAMGLYGTLVVRPAAPVAFTGITVGTRTDAGATYSSGTNLVNDAAATAADVGAVVKGEGIPAGTTVTAVTEGVSFTMSASAGAYDSSTPVNDEAVVVLSEIDPALNNSATPSSFDMRTFAPRYFLINGRAYPNTDPIASADGNKLLLRYVNAGAKHHSMAVLGLRQSFIAKDGNSLPTRGVAVVAETLAPGQTADAIATIPSLATASRFPVYDGNLLLHNNGAAGFGGMLTFVTAGAGVATAGPEVTALSLSGSNLSTTIAASAGKLVAAWEYWFDTDTHNTITVTPVTPLVVTSYPVTLPTSPGSHTLYVRGQDNTTPTGVWGATKALTFSVDATGPITSALVLTPNPTNGTVSVTLSGTANDTATGGSNIAAAAYWIDSNTPIAMTVSPANVKVASLTATIPAAVVGALSNGSHTVSVRSQDSVGNWGTPATITLSVSKTGPTTSNVTATPNPSNGTLGVNTSTPAVRVTASFAGSSNIVAAEAFIDTAGATGSGLVMLPTDGLFNALSENGYVDIPLSTINSLSSGPHTIFVHARDAAGNWGAMGSTVLTIDKTAPTISSATLSPTTVAAGAASSVTLSVVANDVGVGVAGGQYWIDGSATPPSNPTAFLGSSVLINTSALAGGVHTVYVRVRDGAMNWSPVLSATLYVVQAVNDARSVNANTSATQNSDSVAPGLLANDQPLGNAGRTAALASAPSRTAGTGAGTVTVTCPVALGTAATPAIGGNTVCTNGAYRLTLNGVGSSGNDRRASKLGTFQFTYTETLNGVTSTATVTITVN